MTSLGAETLWTTGHSGFLLPMEQILTQCGIHVFVTVATVCASEEICSVNSNSCIQGLLITILGWLLLLPGPKACADQNGSASEVHRQYPRERMQDGHGAVCFKWLQYLWPWSPGDIPCRAHVWPHWHVELLRLQPAFCQLHWLTQSRTQTFSIRHRRSTTAPPEVVWAQAEVVLNCASKIWGYWWLSLVAMSNTTVVTREMMVQSCGSWLSPGSRICSVCWSIKVSNRPMFIWTTWSAR